MNYSENTKIVELLEKANLQTKKEVLKSILQHLNEI